MQSYGSTIGGYTAKQSEAIAAEEAKTHRHLKAGERAKNGDIYGGKDWGFLFKVGGPKTSLKEGDPIDWALCYRIRRKL